MPPGAAAPTTTRAALVLEPPRIGIGQVAELDLVVVTPPGHVPRPWTPPAEVPGVWILGSETLPVEKTPSRWVYRNRVRVRATAVGGFVWPAGSLRVEAPDGSTQQVAWSELAVEVPSLIPDYPGRTTPFGARAPSATAPPADVWAPFALGALFSLTCVGLVALARHRRRVAQAPLAAPAPAAPAPWEGAQADLAAAARVARQEPFAAAHATARALSRYVEQRYAAPATGLTTEELAGTAPPFILTSRWPALVSILAGLDAFRFRCEHEAAARSAADARIGALIQEARSFVEDSIPPQVRG